MANNNQQKLIMEGWRDFLGSLFGTNTPALDVEKHLAMYSNLEDTRLEIILYMPNKIENDTPVFVEDKLDVVGMITLGLLSSKTTPCIPNTFQVKYSAVAKKHQGKGLGSLLYKIAASIITEQGGGITSDHNVMTSNKAARVWNKIERSSEFEKRQTASGNDEFDYTGSQTPDDSKDDCKKPESASNVSDHSFELTADISQKIETLKEKHSQYLPLAIKTFKTEKKFINALAYEASDVFAAVFGSLF